MRIIIIMRQTCEFQCSGHILVGWLIVLRIYIASAVFQPYRDLEAGDNQSLNIQVARPGIEPVLLLIKPRA